MLELYPFQEEIYQKARQFMLNGVKKILIQSATGSGKTVIAAKMLQACEAKSMRCHFHMHRRELVKQTAAILAKHDTNFGIIASGFIAENDPLIQIVSIGSLIRKIDKLEIPKLIIWDEAHHIAAKTWDKIFQKYKDSFHILLTATPERLDGKGLRDYADVMIRGPEVKWLIANKYLCDYIAYDASTVSMSGVSTSKGEWDKKESVQLIDNPTITGSAVFEYLRHSKGKRAVIFAITVEHSENIVREFVAKGIRAVHICGNTPTKERDYLLTKFRAGEIEVVSNVNLFGEGFDLPELECLIMLRPTQSVSFYLQMCGRVLRPIEGKTAIIIDHVGNIRGAIGHGLPCDERQWTLDGRDKKSNKENIAPVKICEKCFAAQPPRREKCIYCGHIFKITQREIIEIEGILGEIDKENFRKTQRSNQGQTKDYESLVELGRRKGYKSPERWAGYIIAGREAKKLKKEKLSKSE